MSRFDPACDFLLDRPFENLFEEFGPETAPQHRCKGCRDVVPKIERRAHYGRHRAGRTRSRNAAEKKRQTALEAQLVKAREMRKRLAEL